MLTLTPSAMSCSIAGTPSSVPGTLIITLGRSMVVKRRLASATERSVSVARYGGNSSETNPSPPPAAS